MRPETRMDYETTFLEAVRCMIEHLEDGIDPASLADRIGFSRYHFHRVFDALFGETPGAMERRFRLERSARLLVTTRRSVGEIAMEARFSSHAAFVKAFRTAFGFPPSGFRNRFAHGGHLPCPNSIHFDSVPIRIRALQSPQGKSMSFEIKTLEPIRALCVEHRGPYYLIGSAFGRLGEILRSAGQPWPGQGIAVYYDDPSTTPPDQLRSHAGVIVTPDYVAPSAETSFVDLPGGRVAVAVHRGPYDGINGSWTEFMRALAESGHAMGDSPCFEIYVNDCADTTPEDLITELYNPLA